jgi:ATP-binding protein involved in chromosome partitioning
LIDPRKAGIKKKLSKVRRIIIFASAKGGVGKSLLASTTSLLLAKEGFKTGLLDLDFHGASAHISLGTALTLPEESMGILPLEVAFGLGFMSIAVFAGERSVPLRGTAVSDALTELLCTTEWGARDFLIVDTPPGMGDQALDVMRYLSRGEIYLISTPSKMSVAVVKRLLSLLLELEIPVRGIIENMATDRLSPVTREIAKPYAVPLAGSIPYMADIEEAIGFPNLLVAGELAGHLQSILSDLKASL